MASRHLLTMIQGLCHTDLPMKSVACVWCYQRAINKMPCLLDVQKKMKCIFSDHHSDFSSHPVNGQLKTTNVKAIKQQAYSYVSVGWPAMTPSSSQFNISQNVVARKGHLSSESVLPISSMLPICPNIFKCQKIMK